MDLKKLRRNAGRSRQAEGGRALPSARSQRPWAVPRHRAARGVLLFAALDLDEGHGVIPRCHPLPLSRFSTQTRTGWSATPLALVQRYRDDVVPQDEAVVLGVLDDGLVLRGSGRARSRFAAAHPRTGSHRTQAEIPDSAAPLFSNDRNDTPSPRPKPTGADALQEVDAA
jgi:hypothetical protein